MLLIVLLSLFVVSTLKISENKKLLIMVLIIIGLTTLTFGLGTDYFSYEYLYNYITLGGKANNEYVEPIFAALMQVSRMLNVDYHIFISLMRLIIFGLTVKWIKDNSINALTSLILYFSMFYLVWTMSAIRQGLVLAIGLNVFHSKKANLLIVKQILLILVLSLIHYSAIFYLLFIIIDLVKWNQKKLGIILVLALVSTFLPIPKILGLFSFIPYIEKLVIYIEPNIGFFDFASLMRLTFFIPAFIFYPKITKTDYDKKIVNHFLLGISIYYVFKFSEIAAARLTIYTFVLVILIIPMILEVLQEEVNLKYIKQFTLIFIVGFSSAFFVKEINAYRSQIGYRGSNNFFGVDTIFKFNYDEYDNIYSFRESQVRKSKEYIKNVKKDFNPDVCNTYNSEISYLSIQDLNSSDYGIMSESGCWLIEPTLTTNNSIYDSVMVVNDNSGLIPKNTYVDLSNSNATQEELKSKVAQVLKDQYLINVDTEVVEGLEFNDVISTPKDFVPFPENISESRVVKISREDYSYYLVQFKYYSFNLNIYLDSEMNPFEKIVFTNYRDFNSSDFLYATTYSGTIVFNKEGDMIWAK